MISVRVKCPKKILALIKRPKSEKVQNDFCIIIELFFEGPFGAERNFEKVSR